MADIHGSRLVMAFIMGALMVSPVVYATVSRYSKTITYFCIKCSLFLTEEECEGASCYWWDDSCHSLPAVMMENCYIIDEEITLCLTNTGVKYLIIKVGAYGEVITIG